jgi:hypothetical protein
MKTFLNLIPTCLAVLSLLLALGAYLSHNGNALTGYVLAFAGWSFIATQKG